MVVLEVLKQPFSQVASYLFCDLMEGEMIEWFQLNSAFIAQSTSIRSEVRKYLLLRASHSTIVKLYLCNWWFHLNASNTEHNTDSSPLFLPPPLWSEVPRYRKVEGVTP